MVICSNLCSIEYVDPESRVSFVGVNFNVNLDSSHDDGAKCDAIHMHGNIHILWRKDTYPSFNFLHVFSASRNKTHYTNYDYNLI